MKNCIIIHVPCPVNNNQLLKRNEKLDNYSELQLELARMWEKETCIVSIIIGALGSIPKDIDRYLLEEARYFKQSEHFTKNHKMKNCQHFKKSTIY